MSHNRAASTLAQAASLLGVDPTFDEQSIRAAYIAAIREHPPDTDPETFEKIRDAYELLSDPISRREQLLAADPHASFVSILDEADHPPQFTGPGPWWDAIK